MEIRPAEDRDTAAVLDLLARSMHCEGDAERFASLFRWKHQANPFGPSPAWVAEEDDTVVGYRSFLRWELREGSAVRRVARAVDTATHPDHQGRGIFRSLTLHALDALAADGVELIFNTPNDQSRPGYLKMGWLPLGVLHPWVRPRAVAAIPAIARGRVPAAHWAQPTDVGVPAREAFADHARTRALLVACGSPRGTNRTPEYLRWRYDDDLLGYRVLPLGGHIEEGAICFRLRRRGPAVEATIGDVLVPSAHRRQVAIAVRSTLKLTRADYALALGRTVRERMLPLPGGPQVVWRPLQPHASAPDPEAFSMGDIELF
jgi:GNAT superfamily N-acetyltransferase